MENMHESIPWKSLGIQFPEQSQTGKSSVEEIISQFPLGGKSETYCMPAIALYNPELQRSLCV
jgi:hypothetical protein